MFGQMNWFRFGWVFGAIAGGLALLAAMYSHILIGVLVFVVVIFAGIVAARCEWNRLQTRLQVSPIRSEELSANFFFFVQ